MNNINSFVRKCSVSFFAYFGSFAIIIPLSGLYLSLNGFSKKEIGLILGIAILARVLGPLTFTVLTLKLKNLYNIVFFQCLLLLASSLLGLFTSGKAATMIALSLTNIFWISILPNLETIALTVLKDNMGKYSKVRMWGSVGFIIISLTLSEIMIKAGSNWFWYALILMNVVLILSLQQLSRLIKFKATAQKVNSFFIEKRLIVYYSVFFLFELSHAPYHGFFSILLLDKGHSGFTIGFLIALAVICEIIAFGKASVLLNRYTTDRLLIICALAASLRWTITEMFTSSLLMIIVAQLLHAFTFAIVHVCAMKVLSENSDELIIAKRQTTYTVITMGLGAALGSYLAGQLWDLSAGSGTSSFISVGTLSGVIIVLLLVIKRVVDYKSRSISSTLTK
ncbi:MFS transporter [Paenibacillus xylanexedens]|uniref:MFS transporter n=1 Tax=Paenibacillus xylanexedens TaxID=528191 RepID=UPI003D04DE61